MLFGSNNVYSIKNCALCTNVWQRQRTPQQNRHSRHPKCFYQVSGCWMRGSVARRQGTSSQDNTGAWEFTRNCNLFNAKHRSYAGACINANCAQRRCGNSDGGGNNSGKNQSTDNPERTERMVTGRWILSFSIRCIINRMKRYKWIMYGIFCSVLTTEMEMYTRFFFMFNVFIHRIRLLLTIDIGICHIARCISRIHCILLCIHSRFICNFFSWMSCAIAKCGWTWCICVLARHITSCTTAEWILFFSSLLQTYKTNHQLMHSSLTHTKWLECMDAVASNTHTYRDKVALDSLRMCAVLWPNWNIIR